MDGKIGEQGANESIFYGKEKEITIGRAWTNPPSYIDTSISADELIATYRKKLCMYIMVVRKMEKYWCTVNRVFSKVWPLVV